MFTLYYSGLSTSRPEAKALLALSLFQWNQFRSQFRKNWALWGERGHSWLPVTLPKPPALPPRVAEHTPSTASQLPQVSQRSSPWAQAKYFYPRTFIIYISPNVLDGRMNPGLCHSWLKNKSFAVYLYCSKKVFPAHQIFIWLRKDAAWLRSSYTPPKSCQGGVYFNYLQPGFTLPGRLSESCLSNRSVFPSMSEIQNARESN